MAQPGYNIISKEDLKYGEIISPEGSRNAVYKAIWTSPEGSHYQVAAKVCNRFKEEEVEILAGLQHKNVITLYGIVKPYSSHESYVIVTEYAGKGSLYDLIAQNRDNWSEYKQHVWIKWARESAEALEFIHQMGHQHGDVKSPNFVITSDDTMKICDFGTARQHVHTWTTHSIRGSWPWMAPEAMGTPENPKVTKKSDVFSFAVVLWELITGQEPFPGQYQYEIYTTVAEKKERLEIPQDCPKHLGNLLTKCWDPEYKQRPRMKEVLKCLVNHERDMADETHNAGSRANQNPHYKKKKKRLLAMGAVQTPDETHNAGSWKKKTRYSEGVLESLMIPNIVQTADETHNAGSWKKKTRYSEGVLESLMIPNIVQTGHGRPGPYNIINKEDITYEEIISPKSCRHVVHKAMWTGSRTPVAAKLLLLFEEKEVMILAGLQHKNIIKLCGIVKPNEPPDPHAIVTEYAEKGSLYELIAQRRDNWSEYKQHVWIKWAREGAEALKFIHLMGYQHGDVKSPNFVITSDDTMKICDFGTAIQHAHTVTAHSTRGSWPWMAPEAMGLKGHAKVTKKSDVFSFAVVLWELITGQEPFPGQCPPQIIQTVAVNKERLEIPRDCPKHFSYLLTKCWAPEYQQRPSMEEVLECLVNHEEDMAAETHNAGSCEHQNPHQEQRLATEAVQTADETHTTGSWENPNSYQMQLNPSISMPRCRGYQPWKNEAMAFKDKPDLSDLFLLLLSREISTMWAQLAILLCFSRAEVDAYKANNMGDVVMQCHTMLVDWRNRQENEKEARQVLRDALVKIGRNDLARKISAVETQNGGSRENQNPHQEQRLATEAVQNDAAPPVDLGDPIYYSISID